MGQRGEILNKALLKRLADQLQMAAVGQYPPKLNLDEVIVTAGLLSPYSNYTIEPGGNAIQNIAGVNAVAAIMAAPAQLVFPVVPLVDTTGKEGRALSCGFNLQFDAAGALAFNGKLVALSVNLVEPVSGASGPILIGRNAIATVILNYPVSITGAITNTSAATSAVANASTWEGWLPSGWQLSFALNVLDGTNFPANTIITKWIVLATVPTNQQPPGM